MKSKVRNIGGSKLTAEMVLNKNMGGGANNLTRKDLDDLNKSHTDKFKQGKDQQSGRSVKSEYDYGSKNKFVDVL